MYIEIHWTCAHVHEAQKISLLLLEKRLVACAQIIPEIHSFFLWNEKITDEKEIKIIFKSKRELFTQVRDCIVEHAEYEVPEILAIPIVEGHELYFAWLDRSLKNASL